MNRLYYILYLDKGENYELISHLIFLEKLENYYIAEQYILDYYKGGNFIKSFNLPSVEPILITNDARLFLKYRSVFNFEEFYQFCLNSSQNIDEIQKLPSNLQHIASTSILDPFYGRQTIKYFQNIIDGVCNSANNFYKISQYIDEDTGNSYEMLGEEGWKMSLNMPQNESLKQKYDSVLYVDQYNSGDIRPTEYHFHWWANLDLNWKKIFSLEIETGIVNGIPTDKALSEILSLEKIEINANQYIEKISNLEPLKELKNLKVLKFPHNNVMDLNPLQNLKDLKRIFCQNNKLESLFPLYDLQNLEELDASRNNISSIENFLGLKKLKRLILNSNSINELAGVNKMRSLEHLEIKSNKISDIEILSTLKGLSFLDISFNLITSLEPLANLTNLETIAFANNNVNDLSPLQKLINIKKLHFENNQVSNLEPLSYLTNLKHVSCAKNKLSYEYAKSYSSINNFTLDYF